MREGVASQAGDFWSIHPPHNSAGIQISSLIDCDLTVEQAEGVIEISGFYEPDEPLVSIR
jgi:hypothetical protein